MSRAAFRQERKMTVSQLAKLILEANSLPELQQRVRDQLVKERQLKPQPPAEPSIPS